MFFSGTVLAAASAFGLSYMRFASLFQSRIHADWAVHHPVLAHAWAHYWMTTPLLRLMAPTARAASVRKWQVAGAATGDSASVMSGSALESYDGNGTVAPTRTCPMTKSAGGDQTARGGGNKVSRVSDADEKARKLQGASVSMKKHRLQNVPMVESVMDSLQHHEDASPMALYVVSRYPATVTKNKFLEISILRRITLLNPPFDLQVGAEGSTKSKRAEVLPSPSPNGYRLGRSIWPLWFPALLVRVMPSESCEWGHP